MVEIVQGHVGGRVNHKQSHCVGSADRQTGRACAIHGDWPGKGQLSRGQANRLACQRRGKTDRAAEADIVDRLAQRAAPTVSGACHCDVVRAVSLQSNLVDQNRCAGIAG